MMGTNLFAAKKRFAELVAKVRIEVKKVVSSTRKYPSSEEIAGMRARPITDGSRLGRSSVARSEAGVGG